MGSRGAKSGVGGSGKVQEPVIADKTLPWMSDEFKKQLDAENSEIVKGFEEHNQSDDFILADWFDPNVPSYANPPKYLKASDIVQESEKAVKFTTVTESRSGEHDVTVSFWVPKKGVMTRNAYYKDTAEKVKRYETRKAQGMAKWQKVYDFAKSKGVKGLRNKMRTETILKKIKEQGLEYNE